MEKCGRIVDSNGEKHLMISLAEDEDELLIEQKCLTLKEGNVNIILTVPHAGTIGNDTEGKKI